jgi:HemY protein
MSSADPRKVRHKSDSQMIRVVLYLVVVAAVALGAVWLADRPGEIVITWPWLDQAWPRLGGDIRTGLGVALIAVIMIALMTALVSWLIATIWRSPGNVLFFLRNRRSSRGYQAISRGLIAIGAGDLKAARRLAAEARRYAADEPLALLLAAQTAQLAGNRSAAEIAFRKMADHGETRLLGLHGLFVEAQRRSDRATARAVAEEAVKANPASGWAAQAVLDFRCADHDWAGALAALDSNMKSGLIDKATFRRGRAVLLTARALSVGDREQARVDVLEAVKLSPGLVPAAALAGRLLGDAGDTRKAARVIEAAWRANPHPDLAAAYAHVRPGDSARDRLARMQSLAKQGPGHPEAALAVARAAIDAREFAAARAALSSLAVAPTQRVAEMMAEIEEGDSADIGRAREWTARAVHAASDPKWTADGFVSHKWLPVSPVTGKLDAFQWKVPLADLGPPGPVIEQVAPAPVPERSVPPASAVPAPAADAAPALDAEAAPEPPREEVALPAVLPRQRRAGETRAGDTVIPLVHSPDDPGPDGELAEEPQREGAAQPDGWWKRAFSR